LLTARHALRYPVSRGGRGPVLAADRASQYRSGQPAEGRPSASERAVGALGAAVASLTAISIDQLDDDQILAELIAVEEARLRLDARACRLAATRADRERRRAVKERPHDPRAARKAERRTRDELQDRLRWTPSQAKRAQELGSGFAHSPESGKAFDAGQLPPAHARLLADTLRWLDDEQAAAAEPELLAAAREQDARTFGRTCRRLLAELDHEAATRAEERRHARRSGSLVQTEDGMTRLEARVAGLDGEYLATAVHAFRRPDAPGERRTPQQATADAVVAMARAALDAGTAARQHGARPHLIVVAPQDVATGERDGVVETAFSGPMPSSEGLGIVDDAAISKLLCDDRGIPVEATEEVRNVPQGVYRGILVRDGGRCIAEGCDMPAGWCDVMHLTVPYRLQGRLTIDTGGLGCRYHHPKLDRDGWKVTWIDGRPILHHPDRPPDRPPGAETSDRPPDRRRGRPQTDRPQTGRPQTDRPEQHRPEQDRWLRRCSR
jgi:hypothetical protein